MTGAGTRPIAGCPRDRPTGSHRRWTIPPLDPTRSAGGGPAGSPSAIEPQAASLRRGRMMVVAGLVAVEHQRRVRKEPAAGRHSGTVSRPDPGLLPGAGGGRRVWRLFVRPRHVRWRPMLVPFVITFAGMNLLFVTAMTRTTAAAAIFLQYTSTAWAFRSAFFPARTGRSAESGARCACAWRVWPGSSPAIGIPPTSSGIVWRSGSGVCYAGVIITLKLLRDEDSAWLVALCHAAAGLVLLPMVMPRRAWRFRRCNGR